MPTGFQPSQLPAPAYIDSGTAAMLFQALAAGALGAIFFFKSVWASITSFFRRIAGVFSRTRPIQEPDA